MGLEGNTACTGRSALEVEADEVCLYLDLQGYLAHKKYPPPPLGPP